MSLFLGRAQACINGRMDVVQELLQHQYNVKAVDESGMVPAFSSPVVPFENRTLSRFSKPYFFNYFVLRPCVQRGVFRLVPLAFFLLC